MQFATKPALFWISLNKKHALIRFMHGSLLVFRKLIENMGKFLERLIKRTLRTDVFSVNR